MVLVAPAPITVTLRLTVKLPRYAVPAQSWMTAGPPGAKAAWNASVVG
jgi:hypothetical protein